MEIIIRMGMAFKQKNRVRLVIYRPEVNIYLPGIKNSRSELRGNQLKCTIRCQLVGRGADPTGINNVTYSRCTLRPSWARNSLGSGITACPFGSLRAHGP